MSAQAVAFMNATSAHSQASLGTLLISPRGLIEGLPQPPVLASPRASRRAARACSEERLRVNAREPTEVFAGGG
jgi:hypothetical protein